MKYVFLLSCVLLFNAVLSSSCSRKLLLQKINLNDFDMVSVPNETDKVGLIFAVDKHGKQYKITSIDVPVTQGIVKVPSYISNRVMNLKMLGNFIQANKSEITASVSLKDSLINNINFSLEDAVQNTAFLMEINNTLGNKKKEIRDYLKRNPEFEKAKFYLIIENITAKSLKYNLKQQVKNDYTLGINLSKIANVNPNLTWNSDNNYTLDYNFQSPLVVFYKTYRLEIQSSLVGEYEINLIKDPTIGNNGMKYTEK